MSTQSNYVPAATLARRAGRRAQSPTEQGRPLAISPPRGASPSFRTRANLTAASGPLWSFQLASLTCRRGRASLRACRPFGRARPQTQFATSACLSPPVFPCCSVRICSRHGPLVGFKNHNCLLSIHVSTNDSIFFMSQKHVMNIFMLLEMSTVNVWAAAGPCRSAASHVPAAWTPGVGRCLATQVRSRF